MLHAAADAAYRVQERAMRRGRGPRGRNDRLRRFGPLAWTPNPAARRADLDRDLAATPHELATARARIAQLQAERGPL